MLNLLTRVHKKLLEKLLYVSEKYIDECGNTFYFKIPFFYLARLHNVGQQLILYFTVKMTIREILQDHDLRQLPRYARTRAN